MKTALSDDELLQRCLYGNDKDAWNVFVRKYSPVVWGGIRKTFFSHSFQYSREDIEDNYSKVFLALLEENCRRLRTFRKENTCSLSTWLTVVTVRIAIDYMRKERRGQLTEIWDSHGEEESLSVPYEEAPEYVAQGKERDEYFCAAVDGLSAKDRVLYDLLFVKEGPPEKVASVLGLTMNALYSRKNRIIGRLRKNVKILQEKG